VPPAGAGLAATHGLPAWARPVQASSSLRRPDSLPFPHLPAGTSSMPEIEHIVVLMMENHSFDDLLGMVPYQVPGRTSVDGWTVHRGKLQNFNPDASGHRVYANHGTSPCQLAGEPSQTWNHSHEAWNGGRNDGFVRASGPVAMRFWDRHDLPFTYALVEHFPMGQRYFCSVLAQTYPNRRFFFTGTASGVTATDSLTFSVPAANGTIWDRLDAHRINWAIYYQQVPSFLIVPGSNTATRAARVRRFDEFLPDVAAGRLPQFTFIDPNYATTSEEDPQDIQVGEEFVASVVRGLMRAPTWKHTALFITYDEHGGYYDHVPPPPAIVVSPWAR
jgi:phospholipase C